MNKVDFFIVGQGLAGSLLAAELLAAGKTIHVFDADHQGAASGVAAGIINPITGRRLVKSWMIDTLLPAAIATYKKQEKLLGKRFLWPTNIHRALNEPAEENLWTTRSGYEDNADYLCPDLLSGSPEGMNAVLGRGIINKACRVDLPAYIQAWKKYLLTEKLLEIGRFDFDAVKVNNEEIIYGNRTAKKIVFCEGYQVVNNPWFNFVPMVLAKGEVIILEIPNISWKEIYKSKLTYVPVGKDRFWVGATYEWKFADGQPTKIGKEQLMEKIVKDVNFPFKVVDHLAAIRPTIKDRRPVLGAHFKNDNILIFNGLGTKGASVGPYWSAKMARYLMYGDAIDASVNLDRFKAL